MGVLATDERQLSYIYSSGSNLGKQILAYVQSLDRAIAVIDIDKDPVGDTVWVEIADALGLDFADILSPEHPDVPSGFEDARFDVTGWLKVLNKNPVLLQKAIAINGEKLKLISSRADILEFYGVDSAGLKQSPRTGTPDTTSNTEDENFVP